MHRREFLLGAGGAGAASAAVAAAGPAAAQEGGNNTTGTPAGNQTGGGGQTGGTTHQVDMTDQLVFAPAELTIAPGDTVAWTTTGSQPHTVTAYQDEIPEGATYFASGGFGSEEEARANTQAGLVETNETYEHTFQTMGTYEYFCIPHEAAGMVGTITVQEGGAAPEGGGGEVEPEEMGVPIQAHFVGLATILMLIISSTFTFFVLKYGESPHAKGGD